MLKQYVIGRVLGHGGFGITYLGWDQDLELKVAIKEYFPSQLASRASDTVSVSVHSGSAGERFEQHLQKFLDEGKALARFNDNPGIVSVLGFFSREQHRLSGDEFSRRSDA